LARSYSHTASRKKNTTNVSSLASLLIDVTLGSSASSSAAMSATGVPK